MRRVMIQADAELLERVKRRAARRGVSVAQIWREALLHELGSDEDERIPPPLTCIGAFSSARDDLSLRASEDQYEPEPLR
jgi:hypothetical protein